MSLPTEEWLTVDDAAKLSGYNPEYIRRLMRKGTLTAKKFSIVWQVNRESLLNYLEKAMQTSDKRFSPKDEKK
jgi:hypothetical protein